MSPLPSHLPRALPIASMVCVVLAAWLARSSGASFDDLCSDLAMLATVVAARDRRTTAMLAASGLAAVLAPQGLAVVAFAIGIAIERRSTLATWAMACPAMILGIVCVVMVPAVAPPDNMPGLWQIGRSLFADGRPAAVASTVTGAGVAAWYIADLTARPVSGAALVRSAAFASAGAMLLFPTGAIGIVLALGTALADRRVIAVSIAAELGMLVQAPAAATVCVPALLVLLWPRRPAANDNPLHARMTRPLPAC